jgi:hypothetical protein
VGADPFIKRRLGTLSLSDAKGDKIPSYLEVENGVDGNINKRIVNTIGPLNDMDLS